MKVLHHEDLTIHMNRLFYSCGDGNIAVSGCYVDTYETGTDKNLEIWWQLLVGKDRKRGKDVPHRLEVHGQLRRLLA